MQIVCLCNNWNYKIMIDIITLFQHETLFGKMRKNLRYSAVVTSFLCVFYLQKISEKPIVKRREKRFSEFIGFEWIHFSRNSVATSIGMFSKTRWGLLCINYQLKMIKTPSHIVCKCCYDLWRLSSVLLERLLNLLWVSCFHIKWKIEFKDYFCIFALLSKTIVI